MNIALVGYGKMGKTIENIAKARGHRIVAIIDVHNTETFDAPEFKLADVVIEFTVPHRAEENIRKCFQAGKPVVSGTTGWTDSLPALKQEIEANGHTLFWSSNFSIGVQVFMALNKYLAQLLNPFTEYQVSLTETHHVQKLDAPSGTAISIAETIIEKLDRKTHWTMAPQTLPEALPITSIREGQFPGIHTVVYESPVDSIQLTHDAKSREGFALGAVVAAEFASTRKGLLGMNDLLNFS